MKQIPLTKGLVTIVDDEDYEMLCQHTWHAKRNHNKYYAQRRSGSAHYQMHDVIMPPPKGKTVDHINGDSLDNRRENLRLATQQEQCFNRTKRGGTSSKFKGVSFKKSIRRWGASICINYKMYHLGYFAEEIDAARAYDAAAIRLFGDMAKLNLSALDATARERFGEGVQIGLF